MRQRARGAAGLLFRAGVTGFLVMVAADGAVHLVGADALEPIAHSAIFAAMAVTALGLVLRGSTA
jgi:hypothetical protein